MPVAKDDVLNRLWAGGQDCAMTLSNDLEVAIMAGLSVVAVLAVEPLADRLWYARNQPGPAA